MLVAIRLFSHFKLLAPKEWVWKANHITLVWKSQLPLDNNYLLPQLVADAARYQMATVNSDNSTAFFTSLTATFEAYKRINRIKHGQAPEDARSKGVAS